MEFVDVLPIIIIFILLIIVIAIVVGIVLIGKRSQPSKDSDKDLKRRVEILEEEMKSLHNK